MIAGSAWPTGKLSRGRRHPHTRMPHLNFFVLFACFIACACGSPYQHIRDLKDATVPAGDRAPALDEPVRSDQSLQFSWEFDSHLEPASYLEWVAAQLTKRRFTVQRRDAAAVELTRIDGGDAYRMRVEVVSSAPTHVRVGLRASAD